MVQLTRLEQAVMRRYGRRSPTGGRVREAIAVGFCIPVPLSPGAAADLLLDPDFEREALDADRVVKVGVDRSAAGVTRQRAYVEMLATRGVPAAGERDPRQVENRFYAFAIPYVWIARPEQQDAGIDLVPVYTNIRYLDDDWMFWERIFEDAVFAAVAHAFHHRFTIMNIASTYDIPNMQKCGTHPVLDIAYSTYRLRILHDSITFNRMDKIRLLGKWQAALDHMRVCNRSDVYRQGMVNCGECWKCVKTRLALMCLGLYTVRSILRGGNIMTGDRLDLPEHYDLMTGIAVWAAQEMAS